MLSPWVQGKLAADIGLGLNFPDGFLEISRPAIAIRGGPRRGW
jgi:hypothetical protein